MKSSVRLLLTCPILLLCATAVQADPADDAEARRRGVPVQQIQLEHAQTQLAKLQAQASDLESQKKSQDERYQSQLADLQKQLDQARSSAAVAGPRAEAGARSSTTPRAPGRVAIAAIRLDPGAPLALAKIGFSTPGPPRQGKNYVHSEFHTEKDAAGDMYVWTWGPATVEAGKIIPAGPTYELARAHVANGKIVDSKSNADQIDQWHEKILAAHSAAAGVPSTAPATP